MKSLDFRLRVGRLVGVELIKIPCYSATRVRDSDDTGLNQPEAFVDGVVRILISPDTPLGQTRSHCRASTSIVYDVTLPSVETTTLCYVEAQHNTAPSRGNRP